MPRQRTVAVALIAILAGIGASFAVYRYNAAPGSGPGDLSVTFVSDPPGATLVSVDSKNLLGVSPVTVAYTRPDRWTTCVSYRGFHASWPDGRELAVNLVELCPDGGVNQEIRFSAPDLSGAQRHGSPGSSRSKDHPEDMQQLLEHARGIEKELVPAQTSSDAPGSAQPAPAANERVPAAR